MSRMRGIEVKIQKDILQPHKYDYNENLKRKHREQEPSESKEDAESNEISELVQKLPQLDKIFEVHRKIGEGTFSSVYLGSLRQHANLSSSEKRWFAIKHLVPTAHPARIEHELRCLQEIGGKNHVIGVDLCLRHLDTVVFVMPYIPHQRFSEYVRVMEAAEVREYARALLAALAHVHSFGVIHRDVKPSNFLYDRRARRYLLVDFGLAQRVCGEGGGGGGAGRARAARARCGCAGAGGVCAACAARPSARAARAGTQGYRPPEVLLKVAAQSSAVDVWAAGVVLASALAARYPLLRAADDVAALAELNDLLGSAALRDAAHALGRRVVLSCERRGVCLRKLTAQSRGAAPPPAPPSAPPCRWCGRAAARCLCRDDSDEESPAGVCGFPGSAFSLARRLLAGAPARRPSARAALTHAFFTEAPRPTHTHTN